MALKPIILFGNPILRRISEPVTEINNDIRKLLKEMKEILYAAEGRAGLAAPQIGVSKQVVVMDCGTGLIELINPEIIKERGMQIGEEACLSFPGYYGLVDRAEFVRIKCLDRHGETVFYEARDFSARCAQHEIDHLNGILYIDHIQDGIIYDDQNHSKLQLQEVLNEKDGSNVDG